MNCCHSKTEIFIIHKSKACLPDHLCKCLLVRELSDALHQVLVAVPVPCYHFAQWGDHLEGVEVIQSIQSRGRNLAKLQAHKPPPWPEHPVSLSQGLLHPHHISDPKGNGVAVKVVVRERQCLAVPLHPAHPTVVS